METSTLKWLEIEEFKILKRIVLISDRNNVETELGTILYTRPVTPEYNFLKQKLDDDKETDQIARLIQEYPKQKNYPSDELDLVIFEAIKRTFPKSIMRNESILFNIDLDKIALVKTRNAIKVAMYFSPEFSNIYNIYDFHGKTFRAPKVGLNVYSFYKPEFLEGQIFYANYNAEDQNILDKLELVHFE